MGRKFVCSGSVIFILLILVFPLLSINALAVGSPVVELKFDPGEEVQYADVAPGESGMVSFSGTVRADLAAGGSVQDVVVNLQASTDQGWATTIDPTTVVLNPGTEEVPFLATVSVPPETSFYVCGVLTISGTATAYPGALRYTIDSITGTILINQYYKFSIGCNEPYQECCPDSELCYELNIYNEGNGLDEFMVEITNLEYLTHELFTVSPETNTMEIPEKNVGQVNVQVATPYNEDSLGVYDIELEVRSIKEESNTGHTIPQTFTLNTRIKSADSISDSAGSPSGNGGSSGDSGDEDPENGFTFDFGLILVIGIAMIIIVGFILWRMAVTSEEF